MEQVMFELLGDVEQSWWYRGRAHTLQSLISRHVSVPITDALDYGAGNGGMAQPLRSLSERVFAFEPDGLGHRVAAGRGYTRLFTKEAEALSQSYDLIMLADVLEHIEDDGEALVRLKTVLKPSGLLAITVPAYEWLWSVHDELNYHHRRYTRALLVNRLREAGSRWSSRATGT